MICPRCNIEYNAYHWGECPHCGKPDPTPPPEDSNTFGGIITAAPAEQGPRYQPFQFDAGLDGNGDLSFRECQLLPEREHEGPMVVLMRRAHFRVLGFAMTYDDREWSKVCEATNRHGNVQQFIFPVGMSGQAILRELESSGIDVSHGKLIEELVLAYIRFPVEGRSLRFADKTGWQNNSFDEYTLPDESFRRDGTQSKIVWRGRDASFHHYQVSGTLSEWRENVAALGQGNPFLVESVLTAAAGPLVRPTRTHPVNLHPYGDSRDGKTTSSIYGGSFLGGGGKWGFCDSFLQTGNAFPALAKVRDDGTIFLEEVGLATDGPALGQLAYLLVNGQEKRRYNDKGSANSWTCLGRTNGEMSFEEQLIKLGQKPMPGQGARIASIPSDAGQKLGIFNDVKDAQGATPTLRVSAFAGRLIEASTTYYGTPIRAFLPLLMRDFDANVELVKGHQRDFIERYLPKNASPIVTSVIGTFALKYAVGQLPAFQFITGWSGEESEKAMAFVWHQYLKTVTSGEPNVSELVAHIRQFCRDNPSYRIPHKNRKHGTLEVYRFIVDGERDDFRHLACEGHDYQLIARELRVRGITLVDEQRLTKKMFISTAEGAKWCYVIRAGWVDAED